MLIVNNLINDLTYKKRLKSPGFKPLFFQNNSLVLRKEIVSTDSYLEAEIDTLRNSFNDFSNSKEALRARAPAALLPLSA